MRNSIVVQTAFKSKVGELDALALAELLETTILESRTTGEHRTKKTFSPSSVGYGDGTCPRRWFISFDGAEFHDNFDSVGLANMSNGTYVHERLQSLFEKTGVLVETEKEILCDDPPIRGFADLIINWEGKDVVGEIKSSKNEMFAYRKTRMTPTVYHLVQLLIYMEVLGMDEGFFLYEDKNEMKILVIPIKMTEENKALVTKVFDWMREVHQSWKDQVLPVRPFTKKSKECAGCPVRKACWNTYGDGDVTIKKLVLPK